MNKEQIVSQLCSLREHCGSMIDKDEPDSVWADDVAALNTGTACNRDRTGLHDRRRRQEGIMKDDNKGISHTGEETQNPDRAASERT